MEQICPDLIITDFFIMLEKKKGTGKIIALTIVFWDIRGFSWLCEILKAKPELIAGFLQDYFETAARVIFEHGGVLDKFIGDGIMAIFGVLNHKDDDGKTDAISAVKAALALKPEFDKLVQKWMAQWQLYVPDKIEIGLGCGIHTGEMLAGNMGTEFRDQFTAVGAPVNFAARIESRSKSGQVLISSSTEARINGLFRTSQVEEVSDIKNIPGKFIIFDVSNI
ncbi:MAG: adenylate/guanylate cyclase domain-containing protein [Acidobacteria bacterium]|nr:adenylate/guanylate cyclase domain-containing protein [Acidobacteriota bacterium]